MNPRQVRVVDEAAAADVHSVVRAAFGARPPLDPPAPALSETVVSLARALGADGGLLATADGRPVGAMLFARTGSTMALRRFGVVPDVQRTGVAGELVRAAEEHARAQGCTALRVVARVELPASIAFWEHEGFVRAGREGHLVHLVKVFPRTFELTTADDATTFGERLSGMLRAGDLLILTGELGAGKTTFTRGIGTGLQVRGNISSPTFVIARVHPSLVDGPALVHVDAYRLESIDDIDDLDLEATLAESVTVVEWGAGLAEGLADDRLEITLVRTLGDTEVIEDHDTRQAVVQPIGLRWAAIDWAALETQG
ncbi:tRNA (adenosine(37)-N6)-threonylcarbamoyltransferase complex ATPase subunit type 1 TsaE [Nocardioides sp. JQ2195]|uniref:tRNA (adenosine(37)-N6)-threonylcarbamoyltransferase complex ATPase subunit type 1 TsaE n=1 Tax=Nocardioides sp. JQ2195 TaxID=2592334 RepID=UPI00143E613F|nr:tRNA (adenosine(37)-N6)-threonylcarbamoyltransferase complex ATPase subunit type 1 TsaE [Nocardioides sp. JQ2195]QIX25802.1 tRNA (adenosine(37)-N6)-threonylcarbamoyltransferase complex ATPase subunit type 1 TsaE [Nocardioides sp. JQ2195]